MTELAGRVAAYISRYCMFPPGQVVGVAVSGGADSVALLLLLRELGFPLHVIHVDHQLRGAESDADRAFVEDLAARLGIACTTAVSHPADDDNLEQSARLARLEVFQRLRDAGTVQRVATGHNRDDQAETVLLRFLRGSHIAGLAGIRPVRSDGVVRPLLEVHRSELAGYLRAAGQTWRDDSSNKDTRFRRNEVRHHLMPALQAQWNPQLPTLLSHHAMVAQDEESFWDGLVADVSEKLLRPTPGGVLYCIPDLLAQPLALRRRLLRHAFHAVRGDLRRLDAAHIEAALQLLTGSEGHARLQIPGIDLMRSFEWLRIGPLLPSTLDTRFYEHPIALPANVDIPGEGCISLEIQNVVPVSTAPDAESQYNEEAACLDADTVRSPLVLRAWRPGDSLTVVGASESKKIKHFFQEARVPSWERKSWPLLEAGGQIVWARKFGVASGYQPGPSSRRILRVWETKLPLEMNH